MTKVERAYIKNKIADYRKWAAEEAAEVEDREYHGRQELLNTVIADTLEDLLDHLDAL